MIKMLVGLLVTSVVGLVTAQQGLNCQCMAYYACVNRTWTDDNSCENNLDVCCDLDPNLKTSPGGKCGQRKIQAPSEGDDFTWKIDLPVGVSGNTQFGEFSWMAAIYREFPTGRKLLCGGSIIYPNIILTAAHSVSGIPASELLVGGGVWNLTDQSEDSKRQYIRLLDVVQHPGFDKKNVANDFALLVLEYPLEIKENVGPVCLPSSATPVNESACLATGWGADKDGGQSNNLLKMVTLPLVDFDTCEQKLKTTKLGNNFKLHDSFICAGGNGKGDTCIGDGGGPLMCPTLDDLGSYVQVGITSWGVGCSRGVPGAYSKVDSIVGWLQTKADEFPPIDVKFGSKPLLP